MLQRTSLDSNFQVFAKEHLFDRGQIPWPRHHVMLSTSALELFSPVSMLYHGHDCQISPKHTRKKLEAAIQSHMHHSAQELNSSNDHTFYTASLSQLGFK